MGFCEWFWDKDDFLIHPRLSACRKIGMNRNNDGCTVRIDNGKKFI